MCARPTCACLRASGPTRSCGDARPGPHARCSSSTSRPSPAPPAAAHAMPDIHWGYGFPMGGVAATEPETASSRPAASATTSTAASACCALEPRPRDVKPHARPLVDSSPRHPHRRRPGRPLQASTATSSTACSARARATWSSAAWRRPATCDYTEAPAASTAPTPTAVSDRAKQRGADQCGTLGSGNHFLEVQVVDAIFDEEAAAGSGPARRTGQRHDPLAARAAWATRSATTTCASMDRGCAEKYGIDLPDRQLACAPCDRPRASTTSRAMRGRGQLRLVQPPA